MSLGVSLVPKIEAIDARDWDALVGADDPFIEHAFLSALERSRSVGGESGWMPLHVAVRDGARLVGALPLYIKLHGYGEYIFDWRWAAAAERAGIPYYPKLVSMVPFTPATGKRVLWADDVDPGAVMRALVQGAFAARDELGASSVHWLFLNDEERALLADNAAVLPRESLQFHWTNDGYASFDDYLSRFRSSLRKQVRRERKQATSGGVEVRVVGGPELTRAEWSALFGFYIDTCHKRGSGPYLTRAFFDLIKETHAERVVAVLAYRAGTPIAGTFNFERGGNLYGRYWGCSEELPSLHFECCYYQLIEHAIARGLRRFEAGAQGTHKLRRGLMPALIHSAHVIQHPGLRQAVAADLGRERSAVRAEIAELSMHGPFKRDNADE
jgi:predicted N-acyltransferase